MRSGFVPSGASSAMTDGSAAVTRPSESEGSATAATTGTGCAGAGAGAGAGCSSTAGGSCSDCATGSDATSFGDSGASVMSNIGSADGRVLAATGRAEPRAAGMSSKRWRASSRGSGSTVPRAATVGRTGVTGGGATGGVDEQPDSSVTNASGRSEMVAMFAVRASYFIECDLRS
jgi:hypothetical protein